MSPIAILRSQFQRVPLGLVVAETYAALQADMATGAIKPRTLEEFEEVAGHIDVFFDDDQLVATVGVLPYGEYGELSMLWVAPCYRQLHLAQKLIAHAFYLAALRSHQFLFACTVVPRVRQVFLLAGFDEVSPACVPTAKWVNYPIDRNPWVFLRSSQHFYTQQSLCGECFGSGWEWVNRWEQDWCSSCLGSGTH